MRELLKIYSIAALKSPVLCERTKRAHGGRSQEFVMTANGYEAGLLSYDDWSHQAVGFNCEIFVLPEFRQQGIGAILLSYAENHALQLSCTHIWLKPYPLDQETDPERLVARYTKNGYFQKPDEPEIMEKPVTTMQA